MVAAIHANEDAVNRVLVAERGPERIDQRHGHVVHFDRFDDHSLLSVSARQAGKQLESGIAHQIAGPFSQAALVTQARLVAAVAESLLCGT